MPIVRMESVFSCEMDRKNFADFCCACSFPLPCLCTSCVDSHCSKPGLHYILPLQARADVTSERALTGLQMRLHQLGLTHAELQRVLKSFDRAKEEIQAVCSNIIDSVSAMKDEYMTLLNEAAAGYNQQLSAAIQESYSHAWEGSKYQPSDPFTALIWNHVPGSEADFDLHFQLETCGSLANPFVAKWSLPFPGFESHPKDAFPLKVALSQDEAIVLVQPEDTLAHIKATLVQRGKIGNFPVQFTCDSRILEEDWSLRRCAVSNTSLLHLISVITLHVTTTDWENREITCSLDCTVKGLIEQLPEPPQAIPGELYLLYQGQLLDPLLTLGQCGVIDGANVRIIPIINGPFTVFVLYPDGKRLKVEVKNSDVTIAQVKDAIYGSEKLQSNLYSLTFQNTVLSDEASVAYYSLLSNSELMLLPNSQETLEIVIHIPRQKEISLNMDLWTRVDNMKRQIWDLMGIPVAEQKLIYEGAELQDGRFLVSYNLPVLPVLLLKYAYFQIFVRNFDGRTLTLDVAMTEFIRDIKAKIEAKEGISVTNQRLMYTGKLLSDSKALSEYNIQDNSTLTLMLQGNSSSSRLTLAVLDKVVSVFTQPGDTVKVVKARAAQSLGLPLDDYVCEYEGTVLENEELTLEDYKVKIGMRLNLRKQENIRS